MLKSLTKELSKCPSASDDMARLNKWAKTFENTRDFIAIVTGNFIGNLMKVTSTHGTMISNMKSENWAQAGENYAEILTLLLGDVPYASFKRFLTSAFDTLNLF